MGKPVDSGSANKALRNRVPWWMSRQPEVYAYCFRDGELRFGEIVPAGAVRLFGITEGFTAKEVEEWRAGRVAHIPGVATAKSGGEAMAAVLRFQKSAIEIRRECDAKNRQSMLDDLDSNLARASRKVSGMMDLFQS